MNDFTVEFSERIRAAGVVGAGGAGFPSYIKTSAKAETVILNAAECEPFLNKDQQILEHYTSEVIDGMLMLMRSTKAKEGIIGIKAKHSSLINKLETTLKGKQGLRIFKLGDFYPAGDEFCLVYEVTGKTIPPGGIPINCGIIVSNVETVYNMFLAQKASITHTFITVAGAVKKPSTFLLPVGTSFAEAIELADGATESPFAVIDGGPMMGRVVTDLETPLTKTSSGILVLPVKHPLIVRKAAGRTVYSRVGKSACDQCALCTELCPRYLLGYKLQPHKVMRSLLFSDARRKVWNEWALLCCECSLCSLYSCPEGLDPRNVCVSAKSDLREKKIDFKNSSLNAFAEATPHPVREYRKTPSSTLLRHLGLEDYKANAPLVSTDFMPRRVRILLSQHIGISAAPIVKEGQIVRVGEKIGDVPADRLGVPVHASIDGTVSKITNEFIEINS